VKTAEYRLLTAKAMSEDELQTNVIELAEALGWWAWHDTDSRRNNAGLPDLILLRPPRMIMAELKTEKGKLRREQADVIDKLAAVPGIECMIWRPNALLSGAIARILK
jgi:hypothetical protein